MSLPARRRSSLKTLPILALAAAAVGLPVGRAQTTRPTTAPADPTIARIRDEGLNRSQVMATLDTLCNVIGPRLTASPGQRHASAWTRDEFARWGLEGAHVEPWGPFGRGWSLDRFSLQVVEPYAIVLDGYPKAWSPGITGPSSEADAVYVDAKTRADLAKFKGKLAGKVVLFGLAKATPAHFEPQAVRMDDDRLSKLAQQPGGRDLGVRELMRPATAPASAGIAAATAPASQPTSRPGYGQYGPQSVFPAVLAMAQEEGAKLVIDASGQGDGGTVYVASAAAPRAGEPASQPTSGPSTRPRVWSADAPAVPPQVTLAAEDFNRLVHLIQHGEHVRIAADLRVTFTPPDPTATVNTVAELPGGDLKDQVVMVGGHLDSWQVGTGATDNAAGSACAMEAIRILKALDLHPRRTIRVALWTGEEEGLLGSAEYVKQHFGTAEELPPTTQPNRPQRRRRPTTRTGAPPATAQFADPTAEGGRGNPDTRPAARPVVVRDKKPEYEKLSVYFNLDNGTGKIRGVYAQSNPAAVPLFHRWLAPFADLGASTVTLADTGSTDHISFDRIGLPGFQFIQDPIEYGSRTHHSTADVYDRLQPDDLRQASTIMAAFLWDAANMDDRFPRKPLAP